MPKEWNESFVLGLRDGVKANYKYVWGGYDPTRFIWNIKKKRMEKGVDCSGFMYLEMEETVNKAAREAGIPGVRRVTAFDMAHGRGGWVGLDHPGGNADEWLLNADEGDLVFFTFSADRPYGHVGALLRNPSTGMPGVAHASGSRGVTLDETTKPWVLRDMVKVRRLTIGDKQ